MAPTNVAMKSMKQLSLAKTGFLPKAGKQTRKAVFLAEMDMSVPWLRLESLIEPFYPKKCNGTIVDATLIAAPSSTKNQDKQRDPEMTQTKKGDQWRFGMKAHIGVDGESCLIHTVECTIAKVADATMMDACLHGEETIVFGDRGYHKANRTIKHFAKEGDLSILTPTTKPVGGKLTDEQKAFNRMLSAVRAIVAHPFRVIKRQFGYVKVRYRGLAKNTGQIVTLLRWPICGWHADDFCYSWARCVRDAG